MTDDSIGKMTILSSEERARDFRDIMMRWTSITLEEVEMIVMLGVYTDVKPALLDSIHKAQDQGALWAWQIPGLKTILEQEVPMSFRTADHFGLSALGSMVFTADVNPRWDYLASDLVLRNLRPGVFMTVLGSPRRGKTSFTLLAVVEAALSHENVWVFTNIHIGTDCPRVRQILSLRQLLAEWADLPANAQFVFLWDDAGGTTAGEKKSAMTTPQKNLDKFARVILGKLGGAMVFVTQQEASVPTVIKDFTTATVTCYRPGVVHIHLAGPIVYYDETVQDVPKPSLDFDTRDMSIFRIDAKTEAVLQTMSGVSDRKAAIRKFLAETK